MRARTIPCRLRCVRSAHTRRGADGRRVRERVEAGQRRRRPPRIDPERAAGVVPEWPRLTEPGADGLRRAAKIEHERGPTDLAEQTVDRRREWPVAVKKPDHDELFVQALREVLAH